MRKNGIFYLFCAKFTPFVDFVFKSDIIPLL